MTSGVGANGTSAKYTYLADGTKVDVRDSSNNGFSYLGSLVYKKVGGSLILESAAFAGGRIEKASNGYDVNFYVTDHLGSVRAVLDGDGMVQGRNDYLPFGESWSTGGQSSAGGSAASARYKFNGKELQTTGGVDLLDYGARMYDSKIGRWLTQDPLAEKMYSMSSYNYCANNPTNAIDPNGEIPFVINFVSGLISASVDLAVQMTVSMSQGATFSNAFNSIDWVSVGTAGAVGAIAPGASLSKSTARLAKAGIVVGGAVLDGAVDVNALEGVKVVGIDKPVGEAAVDVAASVVSGVGAAKVGSALQKGAAKDLAPSVMAPLKAADKNLRRATAKVVNSPATAGVIDGTTSILVNGVSEHMVKPLIQTPPARPSAPKVSMPGLVNAHPKKLLPPPSTRR